MLERLKIGPAAVALNATLLLSYESGIFTDSSCSKSVNHAAVLVGNDAQGNWILQNSWGKNWG
jgi:hypothetical protein